MARTFDTSRGRRTPPGSVPQAGSYPDDADDPTVANPEAWDEGATVDAMLDHVRDSRAAWPETLGDVAEGGMARVYAVRDPVFGRRAAMKVISPELAQHNQSVAWFIREAQITGQLDHPCIVPVHDLGVSHDGLPYFTMKLVKGQTLRDLVDELPDAPLDRSVLLDLLGVVLRVCDALAFAHDRGVIHSDIKPANIMVGSFGQVYLMDWGIAWLRDEPGPDGANAADEDGRVDSWVRVPPPRGAGSPGYIAPEQAAGDPPTERSDVFGVGGLIYYILMRQPPYEGETTMEVFNRALDGQVKPLDEATRWGRVPPELRRIVDRAMAPKPSHRYASVAELQEELKRFVRGGGDFPIISVDTGDVIVREGDRADAAYVIVGGRVEVFTSAGGLRTTLAELGPGEVFGETAILAGTERTASVAALTPSTMVRIPMDVFERELAGMTPWMGAVTRALAKRFRDQLERSRASYPHIPALAIPPVLVLSCLAAWASARGPAARSIPVSSLVERLGGPAMVPPQALSSLLATFPEVTVDESGQRLTVHDPDALAKRVRDHFQG
jgi:serine/threonine-protein kinase